MKKKPKKILLLLIFTALYTSISFTQKTNQTHREVDQLIAIGLTENLALKQHELALAQSLEALKEARGMFLPSLSIEARHTWAGGGRVIDMPIGDMVNPVHLTLNQLLLLHGAQPVYPANIPNQHIPFLRDTDQETKLRIVQPLFHPSIYYNYKIKKDLDAIEKAKLNVFKRQLVADIKTAYYNYLKTIKIKELLENTRPLLEENLHLNQSLFNNHKKTQEVVLRAKAELSLLDQQQQEAQKNSQLAAAYLNFLLNRPLDTHINSSNTDNTPTLPPLQLESLYQNALSHRAEFIQLQHAISAAHHTTQLHQSTILPTVNAVFDYGFQGEKYRFTGNDDYWSSSLVLSWNLFHGGQDQAKKMQAHFQQKQLQTQHSQLELQVKLQVQDAFLNLQVAQKTVIYTRDTLESQEQAFFIVSKKYEQDIIPQIEYMKARNDLTTAHINYIIAVYDRLIKEAQMEKTAALYQFH